MDPYNDLADLYDTYGMDEFSLKMTEYIFRILKRMRFKPKSVLDFACGTGTAAVEFAKSGLDVTGVDISKVMIRKARRKVKGLDLPVRFRTADMCEYRHSSEVDLITCLYDSVNHVIDKKALANAFDCVSQSLRHKGLFIFDVNTAYGLRRRWKGHTTTHETENSFAIWQSDYDQKNRLATLKTTTFRRAKGGLYHKSVSMFTERAYNNRELTSMLSSAGLNVHRIFKCFTFDDTDLKTSRALFVCRKS